MDDYLIVLRNEFEGGDESFLIKLRPDLFWDKLAFSRLVGLMQKCCQQFGKSPILERWMAEGFWHVPSYVRDWTTHENFPRIHQPEYYKKAYERLDDLAYWFFLGENPYVDRTGFDPM